MHQKPLNELRNVADVESAQTRAFTRRERLERWAELLGREPSRKLKSLGEIEFRSQTERDAMRADESPLALAYADPVLRIDGLASDRLGDAIAYFELSQGQVHRLLCSCMNGRTIEASRAARRIRAIAKGDVAQRAMVALACATAVAAPALGYLFR
jgi:hypothetical protein